MPHFIPIDAKLHREHGWSRYKNYIFAAQEALVPVVSKELSAVLPGMPMAFRRVSEENAFELVAVMSLKPGSNFYVHHDGHWVGEYIPAILRSYPFRLLPEEGTGRMILCIDQDSGLYREKPGSDDMLFFDAQGNLSPLLSKVIEFLKIMQKQFEMTHIAVNALARQGLIVPWEIVVPGSDGKALSLEGLYKIDEAVLKALPADTYEKLRAVDAVYLAYAQVFSQNRLIMLSRLLNMRERTNKKSDDIDIEKIFGQNNSFNFNFDS